MILGQKAHTAGDTSRYIVDYTRWLDDGVSLSAFTVALAAGSPADVTISGAILLTEHNRVAFLVAGGSVNENFTVAIQITDSRNEIKNDTLLFSVVAP